MRFTTSNTTLKEFIRVGTAILDPMEIASVVNYAESYGVGVCVALRGGGETVLLNGISADEFWEKITDWAASKP